jgi:hypothetical protein
LHGFRDKPEAFFSVYKESACSPQALFDLYKDEIMRNKLLKYLLCIFIISFLLIPAASAVIYIEIDNWLTQPKGTLWSSQRWTWGKLQRITWNCWPTHPTQVQIFGTRSDDNSIKEFISGASIANDHDFDWTPQNTQLKNKLIYIDLHDLGHINGGGPWWYYDREYVYLDGAAPNQPTNFYAYSDDSETQAILSNTWYTYPTPYFEWSQSTSADIDHYHIYFHKNPSATPNIEKAKTSRSHSASISSSGTYYFRISAEDNSTSYATHPGNVSAPATKFVYKFDNTPPFADITPLPNYISSESFTIEWSGNDDHSGIMEYELEYKIGGGSFVTLTTTIATSFTFTGGVEGATYTFRVTARDNAQPAGNTRTSASTSTTVDLTKPSSNMTGPTGAINTIPPRITWAGSDSLSGIQSYNIEYKDLTAGTDWETFYMGSSISGYFNAAENNHTYCFRSRATDRAGNVEDWPINPDGDIEFTVDAGDPPRNLAITTPYDDDTPTFTWDPPMEANDGYSVSFDAEPDETEDIWETTYTPTAPLDDGYHIFYVRSKKQSDGVWSGSVGVDFIIDTEAPTLENVTVTPNGSTIDISGTAIDQVEVSDVKYQIKDSYGSIVKDWTSASGSFGEPSLPFSISESLDDGTHTFRIKAIDVVGRESAIFETAPIEIDEQAPAINMILGNNFFSESSFDSITVDPKPHIRATITDGNGIDYVKLTISNGGDYHVEEEPATSGNSPYYLDYYTPQELAEGEYTLSIYASSEGKSTELIVTIKVFPGGLTTLSPPYSYPNPFNPGIDNTTIKYELSRDSNTKLMIYDATGKPVKTFTFASGQNGGVADDNTVPWNGRDNFNNIVANGPYLYFIVADGKVIGRGEMAAFR